MTGLSAPGDRVRVTFLVDSPNFGGAEIAVAHHLDRLPPRFATTVLAAAPVADGLADAARRRGDLRVIPPVGARWWRLPTLLRALRWTRPDLVHVNLVDPRSNRVLVAAAALTRAAATATAHMTGTLGGPLSRRLLGATYRRLDTVITASVPIRDVLVDGLGVAHGRVTVVRNGVPPVPVEDRSPTPRARAARTLTLGAVCRLTDQKGIDLLLDAVRRLPRDGAAIDVVIAGDGRRRAALEDAAADLPVRFVGWCDDIPAFLQRLDVFCLPSRAEGLPLALLEALMAGLPCVATDVGDIAAAAGDLVELVPAEDVDALTAALERLITDPGRRSRLARGARAAAAARFCVDRMVADTVAVYDRVLTGGATAVTSR